MICKVCKKDKTKVKAEPRPATQRGCYYRDDNGRMWQGHICPDCFWGLNQGFSHKDRDESELHPERYYDLDPMTSNKCRKYKKFLPTSRYFRHEGCEVKNISSVMDGVGGWL